MAGVRELLPSEEEDDSAEPSCRPLGVAVHLPLCCGLPSALLLLPWKHTARLSRKSLLYLKTTQEMHRRMRAESQQEPSDCSLEYAPHRGVPKAAKQTSRHPALRH